VCVCAFPSPAERTIYQDQTRQSSCPDCIPMRGEFYSTVGTCLTWISVAANFCGPALVPRFTIRAPVANFLIRRSHDPCGGFCLLPLASRPSSPFAVAFLRVSSIQAPRIKLPEKPVKAHFSNRQALPGDHALSRGNMASTPRLERRSAHRR